MRKISSFFIFLAIGIISLPAQNSFNINAEWSKNLQAQESENPAVRELFKDVDRYRHFNFNEQLPNLQSNNIGDTLGLNFFEDKQYKSIVQHVAKSTENRTKITSKIVGHNFAYCYMVVSETTITISAELPLENEYFFASVKNGQAYMAQMKKSELDKDALECTDAPPIGFLNHQYQNQKKDTHRSEPEEQGVIDLLMVYTPAAEEWALENNLVTDIYDLIDIALLKSNTVMENSETDVIFDVVLKYRTDYVETNTSEDLYRITDPYDGYMDEVHELRDMFYADEIVFLPKVDFTGGVAWLLNDPNGFDPDFYAVALCRVQQASSGYTVVHEVGHNLGCGHHAAQNYQQGPGLFYFSSGWRGITEPPYNTLFSTVMTYEDGAYFLDGLSRPRIPYFSSPDIFFEETALGDEDANNALTILLTKNAVASYRTPPDTPILTVSDENLDFIQDPASRTVIVIGAGLTEDISYTLEGENPEAFVVVASSWHPARGGMLNIAFAGNPERNYQAYITFSAGGVDDKTLMLEHIYSTSTHTVTLPEVAGATVEPYAGSTSPVLYGGNFSFTVILDPDYDQSTVIVKANDTLLIPESDIYTILDIIEDQIVTVTLDSIILNNFVVENEFSNITVYSNRNSVYIKNRGNSVLKLIEIIDIMGRIVYQCPVTDTETVITLQKANGIYHVKLISQEDKIATAKIAIIR